MGNQRISRLDQLLDLLVEEIEARQSARQMPPSPLPSPPPPILEMAPPLPPPSPTPADVPNAPAPVEVELEDEEEVRPVLLEPSHAARLMARMVVGLLAAVVLINVPINRHGTTLANILPDSAALVIVDGLVVKEADDEKIHVFQNDQFRWISSLDAFDHYGYTWGDVHIVEDGFLDRFEIGPPIHVLLKCGTSPHIYRLENGKKRWIRDIVTFEAEGHVWEDVRFVSCGYLRDLPDGETIPPDVGPPPQP
jgi:hypothetical protein